MQKSEKIESAQYLHKCWNLKARGLKKRLRLAATHLIRSIKVQGKLLQLILIL